MKTHFFILSFTILFCNSFASIRNGYEGNIQGYNDSLQMLKLRLAEHQHLSHNGDNKLRREIKELINLICHYQLTEQLIDQLRVISPDIFYELDNIKDKRGRSTDVVVKLISKEDAKIQLAAASFFTQSSIDEDAMKSVYGIYSVAVDVWLTDQSLFLLCHELGHLSYVIPNASEYFQFYNKFYRVRLANLSYIGHNRFDKSGKAAKAFEARFRKNQSEYASLWDRKAESAYVIMRRIRQENKQLELPHSPAPVVYNTSIKQRQY